MAQERNDILNELEIFFKEKEDLISYQRIELYTKMEYDVYGKPQGPKFKKVVTELLDVPKGGRSTLLICPVAFFKTIPGDESENMIPINEDMIPVLVPSFPKIKERDRAAEERDANYVVEKVNRLIEITMAQSE